MARGVKRRCHMLSLSLSIMGVLVLNSSPTCRKAVHRINLEGCASGWEPPPACSYNTGLSTNRAVDVFAIKSTRMLLGVGGHC